MPTKGMIVVLGSPNTETGHLYSVAQERCELALVEYKKRAGWKILLTGGYGDHFNTTDQPHAAHLKNYLVKRGIPNEDIVAFAESINTLQDASLSKPIVRQYSAPQIIVITSDFHLDRARYIFEREFADTNIRLEFLTSHTDEAAYAFDLESQKQHERQSLVRMGEEDGQ